MTKTYRSILEDENTILSNVLVQQSELRSAVNNKDWAILMNAISTMNLLMDEFNVLDEERAMIQDSEDAFAPENAGLLALVRGKLVKCRAENKALVEYINISKDFVQGIIDNILPQKHCKVYSRNGYIVQQQPESVVVNTLY